MRAITFNGCAAAVALVLLTQISVAEGPPTSNGVISNPTLVANQDIAKAQAVGVITTFMTQGAKTCDADGKNCHSVFGADDNLDYSTIQQSSQSLTGVQSYSFMAGEADDREANSVSAQTGTLALACGDSAVKMVAGVVIKATGCRVTDTGDATITVQVCSAPTRGNPITQPDNAVPCSDEPSAPDFRPPAGKVCLRPACDSEPQGSLDGWSVPLTLTYRAALPAGATDDDKAKNGLGLSFYPPLSGGATPNFKADSDNMTAIKVVQTFVNTATKRTAVGLKIAYRHKAVVTKEMMTKGPSAVPNPRDHTAQWDTITKLQGNALIPKYQEQFAKKGSECLQQITNGMATDGVISVCDKNYTNESGIKPLATTAKIATEGQDCGTTPQCLNEVVNTNTWSETCRADVPLALRSCTTVTDFTKNVMTLTRTRTQEICHEKRLTATYGCTTQSVLVGVAPSYCAPGTVLVNQFGPNACSYCIDNYQTYRVSCEANNQVRIRWWTARSNGQEYSQVVDRTVTVSAFENSYRELGPFCYDRSGTVPFQVVCNGTSCTYTTWITGNCNGAKMGLREIGVANVSYDGIFSTLNNCSTYESAK